MVSSWQKLAMEASRSSAEARTEKGVAGGHPSEQLKRVMASEWAAGAPARCTAVQQSHAAGACAGP